jgi:molybdopterin converting factor small subunit
VPALRDLLPRAAVAVNEDFADDDTPIPPGVEVAIIPPVSGG